VGGDHFSQRVSAFPDPAHAGENDLAMVRRSGRRVGNQLDVFPGDLSPGKLLRALAGAAAASGAPDVDARAAACGEPVSAAGDSPRFLETHRRRPSRVADSGAAHRHRRSALLAALGDQPAAPGLVRAAANRWAAVPFLRALECRVASGFAVVSDYFRAASFYPAPGAGVVGGLRGIRAAVRVNRLSATNRIGCARAGHFCWR